jgi:hypothetical protein
MNGRPFYIMPIIPATWETEIREGSQIAWAKKKVSENPISINKPA